LRFGVHIPTCIEGMMYPIPFARPSDILPTALLCEELGYDSVWGNDHMTTQRYVQREFAEPPNFYEPLITFTYVADGLCVELKSLKLYLQAYRTQGIFYEAVVNVILDDLVAALSPRRMEVTGEFNVRGGISSVVTATYEAPPRGRRKK